MIYMGRFDDQDTLTRTRRPGAPARWDFDRAGGTLELGLSLGRFRPKKLRSAASRPLNAQAPHRVA